MKRVLPLTLLAALTLGACSTRARPRLQPSQSQGQGEESVWVCHGSRNPRWQRVAPPAADAHRRHGDRVSTAPRTEGNACAND